MKNNLIRTISILIIVIFTIGIPYSSFAKLESIPSIMDEDMTDDLNPDEEDSGEAVKNLSNPIVEVIEILVTKALGVIQILGGFMMVISIAMYGLSMLLHAQPGLIGNFAINEARLGFRGYNPDALKKLKDYLVVLMIGSVLMFSSSSIVIFFMQAVL